MSILDLKSVAEKYYKSIISKTLIHGGEEYILTDGVNSMVVNKDYEPSANQALFMFQMNNGNVYCKLTKEGIQI